jgi:hypothetical protein
VKLSAIHERPRRELGYMDIGHDDNPVILWVWNPGVGLETHALDSGVPKYQGDVGNIHDDLFDESELNGWRGRFDTKTGVVSVLPPDEGFGKVLRIPPALDRIFDRVFKAVEVHPFEFTIAESIRRSV